MSSLSHKTDTKSTATGGTESTSSATTTGAISNDATQQDLKDQPRGVVDQLPGVTAESQTTLGVASANDVLKRSNDKTSAGHDRWSTLNADYSLGFTMDPAGPTTSGDAPIHMGVEGETQRTNEGALLKKAGGIDTLAEYKTMLEQDFNFGGAVDRYAGSTGTPEQRRDKGEKGFLADVVLRFYPGKKDTDPDVQVALAIAKNIWSYATTGADSHGVTDIAQMQGLLYVFDKEIRGSSNTNTKMKTGDGDDDTFVVAGTEDWPEPVRVNKGDGRHGRATMLTTRHLLGAMTQHETKTEDNLGGFDQSYLLLDKSASMLGDEYGKLGQVMQKGGIDGKVSLAGFDAGAGSLAVSDKGKTYTPDQAADMLDDVSKYSQKDKSAYTNKHSSGTLMSNERSLYNPSGTSTHEEGLQNALDWATQIPMPKGSEKRQLVVVTDEPDCNPGVVRALKDMCLLKNLSVKVLYSFNSKQTGVYGAGGADSYVIIDLMSMPDDPKPEWLVDRKTATNQSEPNQQLDWLKVAGPDAKVQKWGPTK